MKLLLLGISAIGFKLQKRFVKSIYKFIKFVGMQAVCNQYAVGMQSVRSENAVVIQLVCSGNAGGVH